MLLSISEIIKKTICLPSEEEKIEFLRKQSSIVLISILRYTYYPNIEFIVPDSPPPWKKNNIKNLHGILYSKLRILKIFLKGGSYDGKLSKMKAEQKFIEFIEGIDDDDAEIIVNMIQKKPIIGLPLDIIEKAYPDFYKINVF